MKDFEMTQEQLDKLMSACKPVAMIALQCGTPRSPQARSNDAWKALGDEMGFDHMTVKPNSKGDRFFLADSKCKRENCAAINGAGHSDECIKAHDKCYIGVD